MALRAADPLSRAWATWAVLETAVRLWVRGPLHPTMSTPPSQGSFILVATIVAKGQSEADKLAELVVAVAKRANSAEEPGTKTYRVTREANVGLEIVVFEEYESAEALAAHQAAPDSI
ncbi:hypothetical protein GLX27_002496 [Malassezia furfur]|uniref:ABM domain-containing protein n=1 Tax=Malassezia furfur TaxID=55194 RepID=A0ABY8EQQ9_MALFU|nr:hypothetical protein GLX27_002496 [Malassezia furfur]